jgi:hypothetical protein
MAISGMSGFYVGLLHPISMPSQLLALLALGVMLGLRWPEWFKTPWLVFAVSAFFGMSLGQFGILPAWAAPMLLLIAIVAATLSAVYPTGSYLQFILLSCLGGLLLGLLSTPDPASLQATIISLLGSFVGINIILLYVSGGVGWLRERFSQRWVAIGIRIVAAWIAAISVLMASLALVSQ